MSENRNQTEKKASGLTAFIQGTGGKVVLIVSILAMAACLVFSGINVYRVIREESAKGSITLDENKSYNSNSDVADYIYKYGHLPDNYVTKAEAQSLGWIGGNVDAVLPGKSIGGNRFFANYSGENGLPLAEGRYYTECDVNTVGADGRGEDRLVFSNDGLIYITTDHYMTFELLYGQEVLDEFY